MRKQTILMCVIAVFTMLFSVNAAFAQGVTTGAISGIVVDQAGVGLPGATVLAVHEPSGTRYGTPTLADGRFNIPGMRVGGPYKITVTYIGYESQEQGNVFLALGGTSNFNFVLRDAASLLGEVVVVFTRDAIFSSDRTGASTSVGQNELQSLPSFSKRVSDFTRLSPMASGNSFAGADNRLNNITVDGSYFNNSFGLAGQPGERTGVAPISMSAIEAITVNVAPYDVRQGHFVGAGVNTVTKSGTNEFRGEVYYNFRNSNMVGREAQDLTFSPGDFKFSQFGVSFGGPIIKNKLFFFADFGQETLDEPGTTFLANTGTQTVGGNITRVLASDLDQLSNFLRTNFDYETGPYQNYTHQTPALRFIAKVDFNINDRNKLSVRYNHLDSDTDVLLSNSSSLGWGTRRTNLNGLNFQNSNYQIMENIRSVVGELNSRIGDNMANNFIVGYTYQDESRNSRGTMFPMVDILEGGNVYTTFGFEPFTPNNELRYETYQIQNNFSIFKENHTLTFGLSAEKYYSENVFFPGSQSVYVYNSLADFYTDANDLIANPSRTTSPIQLRRFQVRWSNIPGQEKPIQPLNVFYAGIYGQDEWQVNDQLKVTAGLRIDVPFFGEGEYINPEVPGFTFKDENGNDVSYNTEKLPDARLHWSPRLGFNWDVTGDRSTQVRGGTGIFTGTPAYVWISNQIGANGMLTGFERIENTSNRPFNPNVNAYKPSNVTGAPASQYELAFSDPKFKFPQIWRTNFAIDQKLPFGLIGTLEGIFSKDVNGIYYINANLVDPTQNFSGADTRPIYPGGAANRIVNKIDNAVVLKNQNEGYAYNFAVSLERPFSNGFFAKAAYSYGVAKNTIDPGSIAFGSWNNNQHAGNPNNPGLGFSANAAGHRIIGAFSYRTAGSTTFSMFWESRTIGSFSYVYSGDMNRDGGTSNDLIYIPKDASEMNFFQFTASGKTFTVAEQIAAWEAFIQQDKYLSKNRGKYAERGAAFLPMVHRADISISHDLIANIAGTRNVLQIRLDIINFGNMLNKEWGVSQRAVVTNPLVVRPTISGGTPANSGPIDESGRPIYRMANVGQELLTKTTQQTLGVGDVYRIQFGVRYIFN
jgi:hypothetical protein